MAIRLGWGRYQSLILIVKRGSIQHLMGVGSCCLCSNYCARHLRHHRVPCPAAQWQQDNHEGEN